MGWKALSSSEKAKSVLHLSLEQHQIKFYILMTGSTFGYIPFLVKKWSFVYFIIT